MSIADSSVLALTIGFPNAAAAALPLLLDTSGSHAAAPAALLIVIGSVTVTPITLALLDAQRDSPKEAIPLAAVLRSMPRAFGRPVVWGPLAALLCEALHIRFPSYVQGTFLTLGNAATGSALIPTGLVVSAQRFRLERSVLLASVAKLLLQPLLALGVTMLLRLNHEQIRNVVVISASPGGFFGLVFGKSFHATPEVASSSLIGSYGLGWITLSMWLLVATRFL